MIDIAQQVRDRIFVGGQFVRRYSQDSVRRENDKFLDAGYQTIRAMARTRSENEMNPKFRFRIKCDEQPQLPLLVTQVRPKLIHL